MLFPLLLQSYQRAHIFRIPYDGKLLSKSARATCQDLTEKQLQFLSKACLLLKMCSGKTLFSWLFGIGKKAGEGPKRGLNQGGNSNSTTTTSKTETLDRKVRHTSWPPIFKKFLVCIKCKEKEISAKTYITDVTLEGCVLV